MSTARPPRSRRRLLLTLGLALVLAMAVDLSRDPAEQWSNRALLAAVRGYRVALSPRLPYRCRFTPTCSEYALAVLSRDGALIGGARTAWRILRCGPWTARGTLDPPEPRAPESPPASTRSPAR